MKIFVNSRSPPANSAFAFYPNKKRKENTLEKNKTDTQNFILQYENVKFFDRW